MEEPQSNWENTGEGNKEMIKMDTSTSIHVVSILDQKASDT